MMTDFVCELDITHHCFVISNRLLCTEARHDGSLPNLEDMEVLRNYVDSSGKVNEKGKEAFFLRRQDFGLCCWQKSVEEEKDNPFHQ